MNLTELSDLLERSTAVLRVETLGSYLSGTDRDWLDDYLAGRQKPDIELKRPWLDRLARAAATGRPWRRLRIIPRPVPDYVRYACEWSYVDNAAVGEEIRVLDQADWPVRAVGARRDGDFYVVTVEGRTGVIRMLYSGSGQFTAAEIEDDQFEAVKLRDAAEVAWTAYSAPFDEWWADSPELHRDVTV